MNQSDRSKKVAQPGKLVLPCPRLCQCVILQMSRSRGYVFTLNNYTEEEITHLRETQGHKYLIFGKEVGEEGTPHLQGYIYYPNARRFNTVKKSLGSRYHIESQKGSCDQAIQYCKKEGDFEEIGVPPIGAPGKKCTQEERAKNNKRLREATLNELVDSGEINIKEVRALKNARLDLAQENSSYTADGTRGEWYWGAPGTGKSHKARTEHPDAYIKAQNKWFDGYTGEETIILDDFDTNVLGHYLKIWTDKWSCSGEVKGGTVNLQHKKFIVTSNYSIEHLWPDDPDMQQAIRRRFKVTHFSIPFNKTH